jgi:hypothetical protein
LKIKQFLEERASIVPSLSFGKGLRSQTPAYRLVYGNIGDSYFDKEVDERKGKRRIDPEVFMHLEKVSIFTEDELAQLNALEPCDP